MTLQRLVLHAGFLLIATVCLFAAADDQLSDLEIHNLFKPETCDRKSKATDLITLNYKGTLQDGTIFDSSYERGEPFTFQLGIGTVIQGWERALNNVCAGEKLKIVVPPHLAYGEHQHHNIPAQSTLTFELEVLKIEDGPRPVNVFKEMDADADGELNRKEVKDYVMKNAAEARERGEEHDIPEQDLNHMIDEIFQFEDKDKDGVISREEFSGPKVDHDEL